MNHSSEMNSNSPRPVRIGGRHPRQAVWLFLRLIVLAIGSAVIVAGCDNTRRQTSARTTLNEPVLVVNAEEISYRDFQELFQNFLSRWDRVIQNDAEKRQVLRELVLEGLIDQTLLDQEARRHGIELNSEELQARIRAALSPFDDTYLEQAAEANDVETGQWSRDYRRRLVHEELVKQEVLGRIRVTDQEISDYYTAHREEFKLREQVRVRHLAVGSRRTYDRMRRLLRQDADFVEMIREYSITPDREIGGDLGFVERGVLPEEFDRVIFSMTRKGRINDLNKPVQTQIGYHIFRLESRKEARQLAPKDARPIIRERLLAEKQAAAYRVWLSRLRERATIVINKELLHTETG